MRKNEFINIFVLFGDKIKEFELNDSRRRRGEIVEGIFCLLVSYL